MRRFLWAQLLTRRSRLGSLAVGILVAAVSFVLLTSAVTASSLQVKQTLRKTFRPAYDILVRSPDSYDKIEKRRGLVRSNYLSGIFGGISLSEYRTVKHIPGVSVAAPLANIGYMLPFEVGGVSINEFLSRAPAQLYRLHYSWVANGGASIYPGGEEYVYYTRDHPFAVRNGEIFEIIPGSSKRPPVCGGFNQSISSSGEPFQLLSQVALSCFSKITPEADNRAVGRDPGPGGKVGSFVNAFFPVLVSAIDPVQEAKLVGLDRAVVSGRYLRSQDGLNSAGYPTVAVIASNKTFVGEHLRVRVERLEPPKPKVLASKLAIAGYPFAKRLGGKVVGVERLPIEPFYRKLLDSASKPHPDVFYNSYYTAGPVRYRSLGGNRLAARPVHFPVESLFSGAYFGAVPQDNRDVRFRRLSEKGPVCSECPPALHAVGRFDPNRLPGFNPLSKVPLETYYPPNAYPADPASKRALRGGPLLPTRSLSGYISQPPLILTTLEGLGAFVDPNNFSGVSRAYRAPISVIRVRVAGVTGPDALSRARIKRVASVIHSKVGLAVDVTAGSSPTPVRVNLPKGKFGQPPLTVREQWVATGVSVKYAQALDRKSLILFMLVLFVCGLFVANAAFALVASRHTEVGTLLTMGWAQRDIFRVVLGEIALVGAFAGLMGVVIAFVLAALLPVRLSMLQLGLTLPIATSLAVLSGLLPARRAAAATPLDALAPVSLGGGRRRRVSGYLTLAVTNLVRVPRRTIVGCSGLFIGIAALTVLVALNEGFQQTLVGTLLGNAISVQVRGVDFLSVALVIGLGALSVGDVLYINLKQRQAELVTLRTLGWGDNDIARVILLEGAAMGLAGSLLGAIAGIVAVSFVHGIPLAPIANAGALASLCGVFFTAVAALVPASRVAALVPHAALAEE